MINSGMDDKQVKNSLDTIDEEEEEGYRKTDTRGRLAIILLWLSCHFSKFENKYF